MGESGWTNEVNFFVGGGEIVVEGRGRKEYP